MSEHTTEPKIKQPWSLELFLRKIFKWVIDPIAAFFLRVGLKPNAITALGLIMSVVVAFLIIIGRISLAGLVLLIAGPLDVVDGAMARKLGEPSKFGGLLDSVIDRYAELVIFGGLLLFYIDKVNLLGCGLVFLAAAGSVMVSYVKARAEALGYNARVGILTRVERLIVMIICLIINQPMIALWIIAILTNITAVQRMIYVHKQAVLSGK